jgi:hypothetical protein
MSLTSPDNETATAGGSWIQTTFLRLISPTPTAPVPRWKHLRGDRRPWRRRIVTGLLHAFRLLAGFCVLLLTVVGLLSWSHPAMNTAAPLARFSFVMPLLVPICAVIMFLTAHRWAPISISIFFAPGLRRALTLMVVGPSADSPAAWERAPRSDALQILVLCIVVIGLTWRFLRERPAPTTLLDRFALTYFAVASLEQLVIPYHFPPASLLSGITALLIAWVAYRAEPSKRHVHRTTM